MHQGIIICCSKFEDTSLKNIPTAKRSARLMKELLAHEEFGGFEDIECLFDPTERQFIKLFRQNTSNLGARTSLYVHIISHVFDSNGSTLIATKDTKKRTKRNITKEQKIIGIHPENLAKLIYDQKSLDIAITLDTCLAEQFKERFLRELDLLEKKNEVNRHKRKRIHFLTMDSSENGASYTDYQGSALTNKIYGLLLTGEPASRSPQIELSKLSRYTQEHVEKPQINYFRRASKSVLFIGLNANRGIILPPSTLRKIFSEDERTILSAF